MKRQLTQQNRISATASIEANALHSGSFGVAWCGGLGWAGLTVGLISSFNERPGTSSVIGLAGKASVMFDSKWLQGETGRAGLCADYRPNNLPNFTAGSLYKDF